MGKDEEYTMFISADSLDDDEYERKRDDRYDSTSYADKNLREHKVTTDEILVDFKALRQERQMEAFTMEIEQQSVHRDTEEVAAPPKQTKRASEQTDQEDEARIVATTAEIELMKKEYRIPNYRRRRIKFVLAIVMAALIVITGTIAGTYFLFFKQTTIDIFKQINVRAEGVNGKGVLVIDPKTTEQKLSRVIKELDFGFSKADGSLSNGDVVTISLDEKQPILKSSRIVPAKVMYKYIVTGLVTVPQSYDDIKNKDTLINNANTQVERDLASYRALLIKMAKEQRQVDLEFNISYELLETWYAVDNFATSCTTNERREACASVGYVYKIHANADSTTYYLTEPDDYLIIEYTGIHYDQNNTLKYKLVDIRTEDTREKATKFLIDAGFTLIQTNGTPLPPNNNQNNPNDPNNPNNPNDPNNPNNENNPNNPNDPNNPNNENNQNDQNNQDNQNNNAPQR